MSYSLLFEIAAAIGTQRMVELCEHYLWTVDTQRKQFLDSSGAIIPPVWRDCSGTSVPATPPRPPRDGAPVCPGAPQRPVRSERAEFNSPAMHPLGISAETMSELPPTPVSLSTLPIVRAEMGRQAVEALESGNYGGKTRQELLQRVRDYDPLNPLLCALHEAQTPGGPALGYTMNSSGNYSTFAPSCSGCYIGLREATE